MAKGFLLFSHAGFAENIGLNKISCRKWK